MLKVVTDDGLSSSRRSRTGSHGLDRGSWSPPHPDHHDHPDHPDHSLEGLSAPDELTQATQRLLDLASELTDPYRRRGAVPHDQILRARADAATAAEAFKIAATRMTRNRRD